MVVTGATSGVGWAVFQAMAERGARVIGVGRSSDRCRAVQESVLADAPGAHVSFAVADLSSQRQVRHLASDIRALVAEGGGDHVDVLIHCAERAPRWREVTEDAYERQFAVNHLAPFLLSHDLLPLLWAAPSARIVMVSSRSHRRGSINWRDLMYRRRYSRRAAYRQSKLANVLFTAELNRRLSGQGSIRAYAADPGPIADGKARADAGGGARSLWKMGRLWGARPAEGGESLVFLATEVLDENADRIYWRRSRPAKPSARALQREDAARLWAISERLCGLDARG
jgi:NAD(P)-dependent dehydrogenase (short-subunit alcohol dehydrogenase family)